MPSNLSPWQQFLSQKFPGKNAKFTQQQFDQAAIEFWGEIPVPPGSQIISRTASSAEYIDPEGFKHVIRRELDGRSPNAGQIQDSTDRPAVLPPSKPTQDLQGNLTGGVNRLAQQQIENMLRLAQGQTPAALDPGIQRYLEQIGALSTRLQGPAGLAQLDPETQAALQAIDAAEQGKIAQQFEKDQGSLIARLYGNRVNQSSIANAAGGQLLQQQGLVRQQQQADAAARLLGVRQFVTEEERARLSQALAGLASAAGAQLEGFRSKNQASQSQQDSLNALLRDLIAQQTQRDISTGQIGLGDRELAERRRQTNLDFELGQQRADMELARQNSLFNKILTGIGLGAQIAPGVGTLLGTLGIGRNASGIRSAGSTYPQN